MRRLSRGHHRAGHERVSERRKVLERLVPLGAMLQRVVPQELRRVLGQVDGLLLQVRAVQQQRGLRE